MLNPHSRAFRVLLGAQSMVSAIAVDMSLPAFPAISADFSTSADHVQLTIGLYLVGYAAGQLIYGPISDRFGRRPVLVTGMAIYALSALFCSIAPTIETLVALRLLQGLGGCVGVVVTRAAVRDHFTGPQLGQILSSITAIQAIGPLVAPAIGGILTNQLNWHWIFIVQGCFAAILVLVTWNGFAESLRVKNPLATRPRHLLANYYAFFSNPLCIGYAAVGACSFGGLFAVLSASPFVLIDVYGLSSQAYGFFFGIAVSGYISGSFGNRRLLHQGVSGETLLRRALFVLVASAGLLLLCVTARWGGIFGIMIPYFAYCVAMSFVQSNAIASAMEPVPHMAGTGASLMGALQMSSGALSGYLANLFFNGTGIPMGIGMTIAACLAMTAYYLIARRRSG